MAMGTVEGLKTAMPDQRTFVLSRAGSPGVQRFAANWLGDNCSRWEHLGLALRMALGMGLSGQPFVGADVGGFMGACSAELLARWYQYAAFTPFCRNHNSTGQPDQYPWSFGPEAEERIRQALRHRYRLLPYLYSLFVLASETGLPIQRPLALGFSEDLHSWAVEDQFLLGAHLLVAPVLEPGAVQRSVYLPAGHWYRWPDGTHELSQGESRATPVNLESIPVWVRGGAVVPCWPEVPLSTMGYYPEVLDLHVFLPGQDGSTESTLQEDDGLSENHRRGQAVRTDFRLSRDGDRILLHGIVSGQGFPEFRRQRFRLFLHAPQKETWTPVNLVASASGFELPNRGENFQVEIRRGD
jgi:alpha-glucosidase